MNTLSVVQSSNNMRWLSYLPDGTKLELILNDMAAFEYRENGILVDQDFYLFEVLERNNLDISD